MYYNHDQRVLLETAIAGTETDVKYYAGGPPGTNFDICHYVTAKWDENKNPNVTADPKPLNKEEHFL